MEKIISVIYQNISLITFLVIVLSIAGYFMYREWKISKLPQEEQCKLGRHSWKRVRKIKQKLANYISAKERCRCCKLKSKIHTYIGPNFDTSEFSSVSNLSYREIIQN